MRSFTLSPFHLVTVSILLLAAAPALLPSDVAGHWEGTIQLPGKPLAVYVDLTNKAGVWSGTIDIPQQNAKGMKLEPIEIKGSTLKFTIRGVPGDPAFDGVLDTGKISGTFKQGPLALPFSLGRDKLAVEMPKRPQEQAKSAGLSQRDVAISDGSIQLAGTITAPAGNGPFAAVLLIAGSGPQNRDEEIRGHKPFKVIADRLAAGGLVVMRVDKRGVGGSGGDLSTATTADFAGDALASVEYLKHRAEVDPTRIGLIGHSEGGMIAPMAASQSKDVAFVILLAAPGVPGDQLLVKQAEQIAIASGVEAASAKRQADELADVIKTVQTNADAAVVKAKVRELAHHQNDSAALEKRQTHEQIDALADAESAQLTMPWFRYFLSYDPREALKKTAVPVLALCGELDRQVSAEQNLPEIEKALREGGNQDVTVLRLPGLNHLFQTARTGSPDEYGSIEETFNDGAIEVIRKWIDERFGKAPTQPAPTQPAATQPAGQ